MGLGGKQSVGSWETGVGGVGQEFFRAAFGRKPVYVVAGGRLGEDVGADRADGGWEWGGGVD
jgi:hypothetical protein